MEKNIQDQEFGTIKLRSNPRVIRYTVKISNGEVTATMPLNGDIDRMQSFIQENREKIRKALLKHPPRHFLDETTELQTATFRLHIFRSERSNIYMTLENEILHIACPQYVDFNTKEIQHILKGLVEKALRHEATKYLPQRLIDLAKKYGFVCSGVKINNSKTHWGSCTMRKSINLSLGLMLLPWHLIDYVLLHELCHTKEMNHSERFWKLMNEVTEGKAIQLREEVKQHHIL